MSPDQQQRAIEKVCGWIIANPENDRADEWLWTPPNCVARPLHVFLCRPPNYLTDLNAMHEAEKMLTDKGVNAWWAYVANINRNNPRPLGSESAVHATAAQRAEAFLRTLNLWQETPTKPQ